MSLTAHDKHWNRFWSARLAVMRGDFAQGQRDYRSGVVRLGTFATGQRKIPVTVVVSYDSD